MNTAARVIRILREAKRLAREYYNVTRRPLGVTGEVAEYEAVRLLRLKLAPPRQAGFDATRKTSRGVRRFQIKGRRILPDSKPGQRMGSIRLKHEWDAVLLVVLNSTMGLFYYLRLVVTLYARCHRKLLCPSRTPPPRGHGPEAWY